MAIETPSGEIDEGRRIRSVCPGAALAQIKEKTKGLEAACD
jgi:hypothetical protein